MNEGEQQFSFFSLNELVDWLPPSTRNEIPLMFTSSGFFVYSVMAAVYILYSPTIDRYYVGSCLDLQERLEKHLNKFYQNGFTRRANDWTLYYSVDDLEFDIVRNIEMHLKKMKSRTYLENLKRYPGIMEKLIEKYSAGSSR